MKRYIALQKIVEFGSFAKAAEDLGYTQSALSQAIASLESELGITLLKRSRTGSSLTDEGEEIFPYIERTIYQYHASKEKAKDIKGLKTGVIRMGTVSSITVNILPPIIKEFHKMYPDVEFVINQGDYTSIEEWVRTGAVDFGFVSSENVKGIEVIPLKTDNFVAVLPSDHPLTALDIVPIEELAKEPFVMLEMGKNSEVEKAFKSAWVKPKVRYKLHDDYGIMSMVESGLGVSLLAEMIINRTNFDIVTRPVEPPVQRVISIGYKDKLELPLAASKFITATQNYIKEHEEL
ncbi:MAG: LysR family transcriptional regulator [Firmicutes bacterium]|nr:LysR family transcriptional regulator [Bacillota bacterium]